MLPWGLFPVKVDFCRGARVDPCFRSEKPQVKNVLVLSDSYRIGTNSTITRFLEDQAFAVLAIPVLGLLYFAIRSRRTIAQRQRHPTLKRLDLHSPTQGIIHTVYRSNGMRSIEDA